MSLRGAALKGSDVAISCLTDRYCTISINIEKRVFSMSIGLYIFNHLCWRLHHRHSLRSHVAWLVPAMLLAMTVVVDSRQQPPDSSLNINLYFPEYFIRELSRIYPTIVPGAPEKADNTSIGISCSRAITTQRSCSTCAPF